MQAYLHKYSKTNNISCLHLRCFQCIKSRYVYYINIEEAIRAKPPRLKQVATSCKNEKSAYLLLFVGWYRFKCAMPYRLVHILVTEDSLHDRLINNVNKHCFLISRWQFLGKVQTWKLESLLTNDRKNLCFCTCTLSMKSAMLIKI